jgi:hypothetical protein
LPAGWFSYRATKRKAEAQAADSNHAVVGAPAPQPATATIQPAAAPEAAPSDERPARLN